MVLRTQRNSLSAHNIINSLYYKFISTTVSLMSLILTVESNTMFDRVI